MAVVLVDAPGELVELPAALSDVSAVPRFVHALTRPSPARARNRRRCIAYGVVVVGAAAVVGGAVVGAAVVGAAVVGAAVVGAAVVGGATVVVAFGSTVVVAFGSTVVVASGSTVVVVGLFGSVELPAQSSPWPGR